MYKVVNMLDYQGGLENAIKFYHRAWGNTNNYSFFEDAIKHSANSAKGIPRFYVLLKDDNIIGCIGLIVNDFISRHDLFPWVAGVFIIESERGKSLGNFMMSYVETEAKKAGYSSIYLTTDHEGYYEKYGWERINDGYELSGKSTRIYKKQI